VAGARGARATPWLAAAALALLLALRLLAVHTASIHWDEFALLHLADLTQATGEFESGGRGGLATALLLPFVRDCDDEVAVVRRARLLWTAFTALFLAGLAVCVAQLAPERRRRWRDAGLALALLALVPAFLESSLQVRTDQLALAGGAWGAAALLASRRRPLLALAAGACLGLGFLGTQKLVYLAGLAALLAAGQLALLRELAPRREALRALLCLLGVAAALAAFSAWTDLRFGAPGAAAMAAAADARGAANGEPGLPDQLARGFSLFAFYRHTIGYSEYRALLPQLAPHALLLLGLAAASLRRLRGGAGDGRRLGLAWAVLALGAGVGLFHAAAFGYFWMTLGVFPAVALALALPEVLALPFLREPRPRRLALAGLAALLALPATLALAELSSDTQAVQRESLAFVHRNFGRDTVGFHPESALFCQAGAQPLPTYFSQHIYSRFASDAGLSERNQRRLLRTFRETPVVFLLQSFRLNQFPVDVRRFWDEHYQPYRASVFVAGQRLAGERGAAREFELIVPGPYRWLPAGGRQGIAIDGRRLAPGEVVELGRGRYRAEFLDDVAAGMLVLALAEPPGEAPQRFYR
jgi:hypothetical protein